MTTRKSTSIPDYQEWYIREHNLSFSAIVQDAIDARILADGNNPKEIEDRHGR